MPEKYQKNNDWKLILNSAFESTSLRCPKCGKGNIFSSYLKIKQNKECDNCNLKFADFDVGDGPAYVAGFIICFVVPILAIIIDILYSPSLATHAVIWGLATIILTYLILIYSRSAFMHLEYKIRELEKK